ncbi:uncharacterized protein CG1161-like [Aricia agestis]|uniref:uncharacterized protein CG1161-like n=1 Tax=Aricia agestis TaxID=91739 RepID=UPI001C2081F6|nr:uncharacterized protein CG1161-like [Aricia agestis]
MKRKLFLIYFFYLHSCVLAQMYEDKRCRCVCPNPSSIINSTIKTDRTLYIAYVPPNQCNCDGVILPRVSNKVKDNAEIFCPRCECKYETRNTTIIMVVVILVVWVLMLLSGYLVFLVILEMLVNKKKSKMYHVQTTDEAQNPLIHGEDLEDNL